VALELRDDPLVAGRFGLVLVEFREYDLAAVRLFQAIEYGAGANDAERNRFFQTFLAAKKETCRLDVIVAQNGVKLEFDDEPRFENRREFWVFVKAGKHKLKASLEGFEEQTIEFDAPKGGQLNFTISLTPVKPPEKPKNQPDPSPSPSVPESTKPDGKPAAVICEEKPVKGANPAGKNGSFVGGVGGGLGLGTTPTPAVGPNAFVGWRSRSWWEIGAEARIAWTLVPDERFPETQFVTWSAMFVPCGRWKKRILGCGLLELDGVHRLGAAEGRLLPGLGVRAGLEFETRRWLSLQFVGDVVFHEQGFEWQAPESRMSLRGSFITGSIGIRLLLKP